MEKRYIRTKDGIYELDCTLEIRDNFLIKKGYYYCIDDYCEDEDLGEIIAEADAIEELCDLFYLDRGGDLDINDFYDKNQFDVAKDYFMWDKDLELKAYIKSGDNIIYVAKINNERVLELI